MGDDKEAKRDEPEVVTPEMIEAGIDCFFERPDQVDPTMRQLREMLEKAYLRMRQVQKEQLS